MSLDIYLEQPATGIEVVFEANVTHNLNSMADEAGLYGILWRPEESGIITARGMISKLEQGIALMKSDPERFRKHNPENGWGSYADFVPWLERLLMACKENPEATVRASR